MNQSDQSMCLAAAHQAMHTEAQAILLAAERMNGGLLQAVEILLGHAGKVIITGMGKSGHIGQKIAATLCSTGTPAVFLHPTEAVHGDLGVYTPGDPTILLSKSGATVELVHLIPILRQFHSPLIGILGNINSPLARKVDVVLDGRVEREADPLSLAPTTSSTVALALGDALAAALMQVRGFTAQDYARLHPSGQLGRNLLLRVADVMHPVQQVGCVTAQDSLRDAVIQMSRFPLGAACVLDEQGSLLGILTDGDVRRALQADRDIRLMPVHQAMTPNPVTIDPDASLKEAVQKMENRPSQIAVLPVVDDQGRSLGLLRLHDIYQADL